MAMVPLSFGGKRPQMLEKVTPAMETFTKNIILSNSQWRNDATKAMTHTGVSSSGVHGTYLKLPDGIASPALTLISDIPAQSRSN